MYGEDEDWEKHNFTNFVWRKVPSQVICYKIYCAHRKSLKKISAHSTFHCSVFIPLLMPVLWGKCHCPVIGTGGGLFKILRPLLLAVSLTLWVRRLEVPLHREMNIALLRYTASVTNSAHQKHLCNPLRSVKEINRFCSILSSPVRLCVSIKLLTITVHEYLGAGGSLCSQEHCLCCISNNFWSVATSTLHNARCWKLVEYLTVCVGPTGLPSRFIRMPRLR